jgi:hypothetical protein
MPTAEEIKALIASMPDLDNPPPPPPEKKPDQPKPADTPRPADGAKPAEPPKPTPPKPAEQKPRLEKGKLTGPPWPDAAKVYDQILSGGKDSVAVVLDLVTENDTGPAYKPRYVAHDLAIYVTRPGKQRERTAVTEALLSRLDMADKPRGLRAFFIRTLQACGTPAHVAALAPLLTDEDLADPAAQAMVTLGGDAPTLLAAALPKATGPRAKLAISQALGGLRVPAATDALAKLAQDPDESIRLTAIWALARTGQPAAVAPVLKATDAIDSWPRSQATRAAFTLAEQLAATGSKTEATQIYQHLQSTRTADHERHVRDAAQHALESLK